jgi:hypothetical protein
MRTEDRIREVVWIKDGYRLVDAESYERTYGAEARSLVQSGYYIAQWPPGTRNPHFFHDRLAFLGPYKSRHEAESALLHMHDDEADRCDAACNALA